MLCLFYRHEDCELSGNTDKNSNAKSKEVDNANRRSILMELFFRCKWNCQVSHVHSAYRVHRILVDDFAARIYFKALTKITDPI